MFSRSSLSSGIVVAGQQVTKDQLRHIAPVQVVDHDWHRCQLDFPRIVFFRVWCCFMKGMEGINILICSKKNFWTLAVPIFQTKAKHRDQKTAYSASKNSSNFETTSYPKLFKLFEFENKPKLTINGLSMFELYLNVFETNLLFYHELPSIDSTHTNAPTPRIPGLCSLWICTGMPWPLFKTSAD